MKKLFKLLILLLVFNLAIHTTFNAVKTYIYPETGKLFIALAILENVKI